MATEDVRMPLKACQRYEFVTTGVGCVIHGDPDCLCDVRVADPPLQVTQLPEGCDTLEQLIADAETFLTRVEMEASKKRIQPYLQKSSPKLYQVLWEEGLTTYEICERMDVTAQSVYSAVIQYFDVTLTPAMLHVEQLAVTGATLDDMYDATCPPLTAQKVRLHVNRMGIVTPPGKVEKALIRAQALLACGETPWQSAKKAAAEFDTPVDTIHARLTGRRPGKLN